MFFKGKIQSLCFLGIDQITKFLVLMAFKIVYNFYGHIFSLYNTEFGS